MVAQACNTSTLEAGTGRSLQVQDEPRIQSEFKFSLNCIVKLRLKKRGYRYLDMKTNGYKEDKH